MLSGKRFNSQLLPVTDLRGYPLGRHAALTVLCSHGLQEMGQWYLITCQTFKGGPS